MSEHERQGGEQTVDAGWLERTAAVPPGRAATAAEAQARQERLEAETLCFEVERLGSLRGDAWQEGRARLTSRLERLRARLQSPAGASTPKADADRAASAASLTEAAERLAGAAPARVAGAVTGEEQLLPALRSRALDKDELLGWFAGLSAAERGVLWRRYERAASGTRERGAEVDEFARAFAGYLAATRTRAEVEALVDASPRQLARWRRANVGGEASAGGEPEAVRKPDRRDDGSTATAGSGPRARRRPNAGESPGADAASATGDVSTLVAAAGWVELTAGGARIALGRSGRPDAELGRLRVALERLADGLHAHAGRRTADEARALAAALREADGVADLLATRHGALADEEAALRARLALVRRQAAVAEATPAARRDPDELHATASDTLVLLEQARAATAAAARPPATPVLRELDEAIATTRGWMETLAGGDARAARRLSRSVMEQHVVAAAAAGELRDVLGRRVTRSTAHVLEAYVHALASSTAREDRARAALERARQAARRQALDLVDDALDAGGDAAADLAGADRAAGVRARDAARTLADRKDRMEERLAAGGRVSGAAVDDLVLDAREHAFTARVQAIDAKSGELARVLGSLDDGVLGWLANGGDRMLPLMVDDLRGLGRVVREIRLRYRKRLAAFSSEHGEDKGRDSEAWLAERKAALDQAEERLDDWLATGHLAERMKAAHEHIEDGQIRLLLVNLGFQLGVSVVGMGAGAMVSTRVAARLGVGARGSASLTAEASVARLAGVAGGVADAGVNMLAQKGVTGDDGSLLTLAAVNVTSAVALGRLQQHFEGLDDLLRESAALSTRWARAGHHAARGGIAAVHLTEELLLGAAIDYSTRRLMGAKAVDPASQGELDWLVQGASIALGRSIGHRVQKLRSLRESLPGRRTAGDEGFEARLERVATLAAEAEATGSPEAGRALVAAARELVPLERAMADERAPVREPVLSERVVARASGARADGDGRYLVSAGDKDVSVTVVPVEDARAVTVQAAGDGHRIELPARMEAAEAEVAVASKLTELAHRERRRALGLPDAKTNALGEDGVGHAFTPADYALVAELRVLRQQREEAVALGPDGAGRVKELDGKLATKERDMGLHDQEHGPARRQMVEAHLELEADRPRRDAVARQLDGDRGHAGVELHTHWMGIVDVEVFRRQAAIAARGKDDGSWVPLLERINAMTFLAHAKDASGKITARKASGDAMAIVKEAADQVKGLKESIANRESDPDLVASQRQGLEVLAETAARHALATTPETDFNSAYEIRDELVKGTFAGPSRDGEAAEQRTARAYDLYTREAVLALARDGVRYAEPSNSAKKMQEQFGRDRVEAAIAELVASGELTAGQVDLGFLTMVTTNHFGARPAEGPPVPVPASDPKQWEASLARLRATVGEEHVRGIDIAGQELFQFDPVMGGERFLALYDLLLAAATARGQQLTLRPHVGEGAVETLEGQPYHRDEHRHRTPNGGLPHYELARHNLDAVLTVVERLQAEGRYDPARVDIRFGHATHATPDQVVRMKALGITAEINLGSNVATGSLDQTIGGVDGRPSPVELYDDHALPTMLYYDATTVLSTDAHSVMTTNMRQEYLRAAGIIEEVVTGARRVRLRAAEARGRGEARGGDGGERWLAIHELDPAERERYVRAYEKVHADARSHDRTRPELVAGGRDD